MSSIASNSEDLILNADGGSSTVKFKIDGTEKASISSAGAFTSTTIDATKLTGDLPAISGANLTGVGVAGISSSADATAITINSSENVGIGVVPEVTHPTHDALQLGGNGNWSSYGTQGASGEMDFQHNAYFATSGNDKYISTDEATKYRQGGGTHRFYTAPSGSADAAITWTQRARIDSDGLKFNNDSAAANALDDYEEGTWSPVLTGSNNTSHNTGRYTKIGKQVLIEGEFRCTSYSNSGSTAVTITGMPYAVANISNYNVTGSIYAVNGFNQTNDHGYTIYAGANTTTISIYGQNQSTGVNYDSLQRSEMSSGIVEVFVTMHYTTA